ncbi:MAG: hypothetical protein CSA58_04605 [Micrococcales bacterium]|nr:MAG: hypothetical protein CSA58_04605 [Micrococcales bacterium]
MNLETIDWASIAQRAVSAVIILVVTWAIARVVRMAMSRLIGRIGFLQRQGEDGQTLGASLGQIGSLLVWLFGLVALLNLFALSEVLTPIQGMLQQILGYLPNVIGAAFVLFMGFVIAKIARELTQTALSTAGADRWAAQFVSAADRVADQADGRPEELAARGQHVAERTRANQTGNGRSLKISSLLGNLVYGVILVVIAIAALQILGISSISEPAQAMLGMILDVIPLVLAACILLAIGSVIARFAGDLLDSTLAGLGTDRALAQMGIEPTGQSPSTIITRVAQIAIMLFFGVMATRMLGFPEITAILNQILALGGRVLFGGLVIAAGVFIANMLARVISDNTGATVIRFATMALFVAMGLTYMGIADSIINLAFGAIVVGAAAAAAIAFGLGGRDAAARSLSNMQSNARRVDLTGNQSRARHQSET